ncbi:Chemotaxis regulator - transmits chemoreceptor signals to flagellar motor components CheY [hydrothermal vent metagenome]|uniref:Chemotaxis regulator - transmits chemoreceptor signals to flagellar motor components CheY n=1 Tax=hydrothermal vent metagenome TaxID=652676 RepID=A0A3B0UJN3_9ZZZZ
MLNTLLIVDDSESIRELISSNLKDAGYKVIKAVNGQDGLDKLCAEVKLVVTDLNMPIMDGITMIKNIRKNPSYKHMPIIMLTTESQLEKKNAAREAGATAWMVKPFEEDKLLGVVKKFVR